MKKRKIKKAGHNKNKSTMPLNIKLDVNFDYNQVAESSRNTEQISGRGKNK